MNHFNLNESFDNQVLALAFSNLTAGTLAGPNTSDNARNANSGWLSRFCQRQLLGRFQNLETGFINVRGDQREWELGNPKTNDLRANIYVNNEEFYRRILFGATIGAAESFVEGDWDTDDLTAVIRIFIQNLPQMMRVEKSWARVKNATHWLTHQLRRNTKSNSRKNIHDHYDLGNDFYQLFLDPTMNYSSGIFADPEDTMEEASINKMNWIGEKLQLSPSDHVLEIGTGWGGLAIHLAKHFGCKVTTTTISKEQFKLATARVAEAGLEDRITLLLEDYRDLTGKYDKLVSIEMIEAVGHQYFDQYFGKCSSLLKDDGLMLIQAICISQQNYAHHIRNVDFIRRYIFPGGCLPSVVAIGDSLGRATDMRTVHHEDITEHYVTTLQRWTRAFHFKMESVRKLGYDQSFIRLWHFYLCYCEAAFAERRVHNVQMVFAKPKSPIDPANDYVSRANFEKPIHTNQVLRPLESAQ